MQRTSRHEPTSADADTNRCCMFFIFKCFLLLLCLFVCFCLLNTNKHANKNKRRQGAVCCLRKAPFVSCLFACVFVCLCVCVFVCLCVCMFLFKGTVHFVFQQRMCRRTNKHIKARGSVCLKNKQTNIQTTSPFVVRLLVCSHHRHQASKQT